jgi:hypothetical protein
LCTQHVWGMNVPTPEMLGMKENESCENNYWLLEQRWACMATANTALHGPQLKRWTCDWVTVYCLHGVLDNSGSVGSFPSLFSTWPNTNTNRFYQVHCSRFAPNFSSGSWHWHATACEDAKGTNWTTSIWGLRESIRMLLKQGITNPVQWCSKFETSFRTLLRIDLTVLSH